MKNKGINKSNTNLTNRCKPERENEEVENRASCHNERKRRWVNQLELSICMIRARI